MLRFLNFNNQKGLKEQRSLFSSCFPEHKDSTLSSNEYYFWKFHSFPTKNKSHEYAVYDGNSIIGYYAALPYRYSINGVHAISGMVCDIMIHPLMRNKGIFTKLGEFATMELKKEGIAFTTGFPIRKEVIPGHLKIGWQINFQLPLYICPLKANDILKSKKIAFFSPLVNCVLKALHIGLSWRNKTKLEIKSISSSEIDTFVEYESFLNKWTLNQKCYLIKTRDFLKWRLGAFQYNLTYLKKDSSIVALAISRMVELNGVNSLALLDLMVLPEHIDCLPQLMVELRRQAKTCNVEVIVGMFSRFWARKYKLWRSGFVRSPFSFTFITKRLDNTISDQEFSREDQWHLMWIDSDDL